ncbi:MAG: molybdopterin-dependent oxidoreductase, partial [Alphaproteobacteria bacterium]|nr:molybdopterin-dependent oxidoreductase [Alphaproteobacteria bacterium]
NKDPWSIASGNYASRFAGAVTGAAHKAAMKLRERLTRIAAADLNIPVEEVEFGGGKVYARGNPDNALPIARPAAKAHWSPLSVPDEAGVGLRETAIWTMPELTEPDEADRINSSGSYGFIFDICGVEIDPDTFAVRIDKYVTMHDAGRLLNPMLADGQIRGGFSNALGAALYEELAYAADGSFLSGTFVDYLPPTAVEVPDLVILHDQSPSPFTPLGSKGLGEGNCMSTPVCIANAVADAVDRDITTLPLTRSRLAGLVMATEAEDARSVPVAPAPPPGEGHALRGEGSTMVPASPADVWAVILDEEKLASVIPGCHELQNLGDNAYRADVTLGIGPVKGRFRAEVVLLDLDEPRSLRLVGGASGPLGISQGEGHVTLVETPEGTRVDYHYAVRISGKVAAVGSRLIDGAARTLINSFFKHLVSQTTNQATGQTETAPAQGLFARILAFFGITS